MRMVCARLSDRLKKDPGLLSSRTQQSLLAESVTAWLARFEIEMVGCCMFKTYGMRISDNVQSFRQL